MKIPKDYLERVYAGFLGMNIGIRIGAPVEATIWSYERIQKTYGDIHAYVKDYINFAADDDANGPFFFLRALYDDAKDHKLIPQDVAKAWINYTREGVGMFWWGGYGRSTEHTAYLNLKAGLEAPQSGSIAQNGKILAEQIGGQIFIDTWGLVNPCNPSMAADLGAISASVSHDGEGLEGARFICAAIALAFCLNDIHMLVREALSHISPSSTYHKVVEAVIAFHTEHPDDFRACRNMLERDWGYDKYLGVCHIIPNAGICILSMLYGNGDFNRTVEIATMCGWDTDCNAGNVGTILGVMCGLDGIADRYRKPLNDGIVLSGASGYLNILDIPTYAKELTLLGYRLSGEEAPKALEASYREGELYFDFELPGSTHNFRISNTFFSSIAHSTEQAFDGTGSLAVLIDRVQRGEGSRIFYKPFYRREDFSDERYSPVFSPKAYSGQSVSMKVFLDQWEGSQPILIAPYVRLSQSKEIVQEGFRQLARSQWEDVSFIIPDSRGEEIDEIGILYEGNCKEKTLGKLYIDNFQVTGKADYFIDLTKQCTEFGNITPFAQNLGAWSVEEGMLHAISHELSESFTGNYFSKDIRIQAPVEPQQGNGHMLAVRAQGTQRGYFAGMDTPGKVAIYRNTHGLEKIAEAPFHWEYTKRYELALEAAGDTITLFINGQRILAVEDSSYRYGMVGFARLDIGRTKFGNPHVKEL